MKAIIFALIAVLLWSAQNVVIDMKLRQYSTSSLIVLFYVTLLPLGVIIFLWQKHRSELVVPSGSIIWVIVAIAAGYLLADIFYLQSYSLKGNVYTITTIVALMPVVVATIKFPITKTLPSGFHITAMIMAILAVLLVAIGDQRAGSG